MHLFWFESWRHPRVLLQGTAGVIIALAMSLGVGDEPAHAREDPAHDAHARGLLGGRLLLRLRQGRAVGMR